MGAALQALIGPRLFRFATVGVGATASFFGLSWLFVSFGMPPFWGSLLAYGIAFFGAYSAQRAWTFEGRHSHNQVLPRYLVLQLGCALFSAGVAHVAVTRFGLSALAMSALTALAASAASYVFSTFWVFVNRD